MKRFSAQVKRGRSRKHCRPVPQHSKTQKVPDQDESENFLRLRDTLQRLPQTYTLEPLHQNETRFSQGPTCDCWPPCFLHFFPARAEYAKTLDLPEIAQATDDRYYPLFTRFPRWPGIGGEFLPYHKYPDWDQPLRPNPLDEENPRYILQHYDDKPLVAVDDFVVSMSHFFAGYRDADAKRHGEAIKFLREWDEMWREISCTKRKKEQWNRLRDEKDEDDDDDDDDDDDGGDDGGDGDDDTFCAPQ